MEVFESTKKSCKRCLTRVDKQGVTHYYHKAVVCATVGSDPHIVLGYEMLGPKKGCDDKDEGELSGSKRLVSPLRSKFISKWKKIRMKIPECQLIQVLQTDSLFSVQLLLLPCLVWSNSICRYH